MDVVIFIQILPKQSVGTPIDKRHVVNTLYILFKCVALKNDFAVLQVHSIYNMFEIPEVTIYSETFIGGYTVNGNPMTLLAESSI